MMTDEAAAEPETHGLAPGRTAAMMGMMTMVRVLPPDKYDEMSARIKAGKTEKTASVEMHRHE